MPPWSGSWQKSDRLKRNRLHQRKVEVLGKAVVRKVALLQGRPSLEQQTLEEGTPGEPDQEPRQTVVPLEDSLGDAAAASTGQAIRQEGKMPLRDHGSGCCDRVKLLRTHVEPQSPSAKVLAFSREHRIEADVRRGEAALERFDGLRGPDLVELEEEAQPPDDRAHAETDRILDESRDLDLLPLHPQPLCHLGKPTRSILRVPEPVDHRALEVLTWIVSCFVTQCGATPKRCRRRQRTKRNSVPPIVRPRTNRGVLT